MRYAFFMLCLLGVNFHSLYGQETYSEYWQEVDGVTWEKGPFQLLTYAKLETGDKWTGVRFYQLSEQLGYQYSKNFLAKVNYRYVHGKDLVVNSPWRWQHRLELEANPSFDICGGSLIKIRNRLEIRKIEKEPKIRYRFRQMIMWVFSPIGIKNLKNISVYNEIFYDLSRRRFQQDRICPCMLSFTVNKRISVDAYFLIRLFLHEERWRRSFILGSYFHF